jgi:hypothetical protein
MQSVEVLMFQRSVRPHSGSESKPRNKPTRSSLQAQQAECRNPGFDNRLGDNSESQAEHTSVASARLHGVISRKTVIAVRNSNPKG